MKTKFLDVQSNPKLKKLNLGCGKDIRPVEDNWINTDTIASPGVQKINIFKLPLPFESNSFDYVLAKHVLEHVPHNIPEYGYECNFLQLLMEELWRIMNEGAILDIEVPGGISSLAQAIDHKRIITPQSFHIFYPEDKWSYYSSCRFELVNVNRFEPLRFKILRVFLKKMFDLDITYLRNSSVSFCLRKLPPHS